MAKKDERIVETRLGTMTLPEERVLTFPRGLIGFMGHREFTLIQLREESPFLVLQSLDDPKLGLLVTDPYSFLTEYEVVKETATTLVVDAHDGMGMVASYKAMETILEKARTYGLGMAAILLLMLPVFKRVGGLKREVSALSSAWIFYPASIALLVAAAGVLWLIYHAG